MRNITLSAGKVYIFDFDGTLVEATKASHQRMEAAFLKNLAAETGQNPRFVEQLFAERQKFVLANPEKHGLASDDGRLACGLSDELIILSATGYALEKDLRPAAGMAPGSWHSFIQSIYYAAYTELGFQFKSDAKQVIPQLDRTKCWIVTNSPDEKVKQRITELSDGETSLSWMAEHVTGKAQKLLITDDRPLTVPLKTHIPGLGRDVFLRRGNYFDIVDRERAKRGAQWSEVTIIGDIAELDLAMFVYLGAQVVLVKGPFTAPHEIAYIQSLPNGQGRVIEKLTELL